MTDTAVAAPRVWAGRARVPRPVSLHDRLVLGLVGVHVVAVLWLTAGGGLFIDDIRAQAYAAGRSWWPFVIESNGTHLAPGARTVDWLMATFAPLAHWPATALSVVIAALYALAVVRLARMTFPAGPAQVVAVGLCLFAASVVPTFAWFRQALTTMLPLALLLLATSFVLEHARTGRRGAFLSALGLHALALTFSERALALPFVVLAVALVAAPASRLTARVGRAALRTVPFVLLNLGFLTAYAGGEYDRAERSDPGVLDAARKLGHWVVVDLLPSFLGGPVRWQVENGPYSSAHTTPVLVGAGVLAAVALLVAAGRTPGAARAGAPVVAVALAYAIPVLTLVYVGRLAVVDDVTASDDLRLLPDVSAAAGFAVAALVGAVLQRRASSPRRRALLGGAALVVALLTVVTWAGFAIRWHDSPTGAYFATLRAALGGSDRQVVPTPVPADVVPGWVDPAFTTGPLVQLLAPDRLDTELSGDPVAVTVSGALQPVRFTRVAAATPPSGFCGFAIPRGETSVTIPLGTPAPYYRGSMVQLGVLAGDAVRLDVVITDRQGWSSGRILGGAGTPELLRGPHRVAVPVPPGRTVAAVSVVVRGENTEGVCVTSAQIVTVGTAG